MYKSIAAYAAALIFRDMVPVRNADGDVQFGLDEEGKSSVSFFTVRTFSILGALRYAQYALTDYAKPYNTVYERLSNLAREEYNLTIGELNRSQAYDLLLQIAR